MRKRANAQMRKRAHFEVKGLFTIQLLQKQFCINKTTL